MTLHILQTAPSPELARALADFEAQFTYPLGPGQTFRISHGDDYPCFFRAQGDGACFVLENAGRVAGALGVAVRCLLLPDGKECTVAYVGDLKVDPAARRSLTYLRLAFAAHTWVGDRTEAGYGVVMDGTSVTPDAYTGQFGIPAARVLGQLVIWQFHCLTAAPPADADRCLSTAGPVLACYRDMSRGRYAAVGARPQERSEMPPTWLLHPDGLACGLVEDTRRAKRLVADSGEELRSAHLSFFAWRTPKAGRELIDAALNHAARWGHPALFVAAARQDALSFEAALGGLDRVEATATVYGSGLDDGSAWNINTAEI
ncbi:MAG: GNAT family N-acetyltransferase [Gemmataceae bacterium]